MKLRARVGIALLVGWTACPCHRASARVKRVGKRRTDQTRTTSATHSLPAPIMSTCSTGDAFQVNALVDYGGVSLDGCYEDSGTTYSADILLYSLDGVIYRDTVYAPTLPIAFAGYEVSAGHSVWFVGYQLREHGVGILRRCRDADQQDANTLHPSEVRQWNCYNETPGDPYVPTEYVLEDYVTITCGCSTPEPTLAPPPSPEPEPASTCADGESFFVDTVATQDGVSLTGCFEDTGSAYLGVTAYFAGTIDEPGGESPFVYAAELFPGFPVWSLGTQLNDGFMYTSSLMDSIACVDADYQNASTIHPTEVDQWDCFHNYEGTLANPVTTTCGCSGLEPSPAPADSVDIWPGSTFAPTMFGTQGPSQAPTQGPTEAYGSVLRPLAETAAVSESTNGDGGASVDHIIAGAVGGVFVVCGLVVGFLLKTGRLKTGTRGTSSSPVPV